MGSEETPLAVTDTHALIWAIEGKGKRLGKHARRLFERADEGKGAIYIPAHVLAELGEACHVNRFSARLTVRRMGTRRFRERQIS